MSSLTSGGGGQLASTGHHPEAHAGQIGAVLDLDTLKAKYNFVRKLRKCIYGDVYAAVARDTDSLVAIKKISVPFVISMKENLRLGTPVNSRLKEDWLRELMVMRDIQKSGGHPYIISLLDDFEVPDLGYFMVFEFCDGGELFDRMETVGWSQEEALVDVFNILSAVARIHSLGYAHCDLSLENFMYSSVGHESNQASVRIIDFGGAQRASPGDRLTYPDRDVQGHSGIGKVFYKSPRNVQGLDFDAHKNDVWSCGITLFMLMTGIPPWNVALEGGDRIFKEWIRGERYFRELMADWANIEGPDFDPSRPPCPDYNLRFTPVVWDLLIHMLDIDENKRYTAEQALAHECFASLVHPSAQLSEESAART